MFCTNKISVPIPSKRIHAPLHLTDRLAEGMVKKGHKVTLFASSDSKTKAKLVSNKIPSLWRNKSLRKYVLDENVIQNYELPMVSKIYQMAQKRKFDIIHIHPYKRGIHFAPLVKTPTVFTLHDPIGPNEKFLFSQYKNYKNIFFVSISNSQRKPMPKLNYIDTVYEGVDIKKYKFCDKPSDYLIQTGRISPEKGVDISIDVAKKTNEKLKITGSLFDKVYWEKDVKPKLNKKIKYMGLLPRNKLPKIIGKAKAMLFPIQWEEAFGIVMIEAMACGTPVIAFKRGSVSEIIKHGKTGFVVKNKGEMIKAVKNIGKIDRKKCRKHVEDNFTLEKMLERYEKVYKKVLKKVR